MPMTAQSSIDAALEQGAVADDHVAADDRRQPGSAVDHRVVLHGRALADLDPIEVAAQHRAEPDARARARPTTSPMSVAVGARKASSATSGVFPSKVRIVAIPRHRQRCCRGRISSGPVPLPDELERAAAGAAEPLLRHQAGAEVAEPLDVLRLAPHAPHCAALRRSRLEASLQAVPALPRQRLVLPCFALARSRLCRPRGLPRREPA